MIAPAKLHIPNFTIGDSPVQKISFNNITTNYENYFPSYLPAQSTGTATLTPVKAFNKYFLFSNNIALGSNYYITDSLVDPNWTRYWYSPINVPLHNYRVLYGGGFYCVPWDFCYAQNKLLITNSAFFNSSTAEENMVEYGSDNGIITSPNFYLYTTNGTTWLSGGLPYQNKWRDIKYFDNKFLMVGSTNTNFPYISSIIHSYDGINWNSSNTVPISGEWERLGYGNGKYVVIPVASLSSFNTSSSLLQPLSGLYSNDGVNWTTMELLSSNGSRTFQPILYTINWKKIIYFKNKFIVFRDGSFNKTIPSFLYSYDGINWQEGWTPDFQENFGALDVFGDTITVAASSLGTTIHNPEIIEDKLVVKVNSGSRLSKELISDDGINWSVRTTSFWGVTPTTFKDDNDKMIYNEHWLSINAKGWRLWHRNPSKVPPKRKAVYTANFISLNISVNNESYTIDQFGTNNPLLTCHREANYDFIIQSSSHPFALRTTLNNTTSEVSGTYNNNIINGISSNRIMFTPNKHTPDIIYYQCTIHPSMSGIIYIKNW